jgi:hypothetical protein
MAKVIIINISDTGILGAETYNALTKKYGKGDISLHDSLDNARAWLSRQTSSNPEQIRRDHERLQFESAQSTVGKTFTAPPPLLMETENPKIIVCVHGRLGDITNCYFEDSGPDSHKELMSYKELAGWLLSLLKSDSKINLNRIEPVNLILAMCYGGRTAEIRDHHINNISINFEETFAANFIKTFSEKVPELIIQLSAFTGTVKFNADDGEIIVSTEETIFAILEMQDKQVAISKLELEIKELEQEKKEKERSGEIFIKTDILEECVSRYETSIKAIAQQFFSLDYKINYGTLVLTKRPGEGLLINKPKEVASLQSQNEEGREVGCATSCSVFSATKNA